MSEPTVTDIMSAYAADAVVFAKENFNFTLDYSYESVEQVETIAETLYASRPKGFWAKLFRSGPSREDVQIVCKMLGGYIGEVFRRLKGGEWVIHEESGTVSFRHGATSIFPPAKVHDRLTLGDEDNLWIYFRLVLAEPWGRKPETLRAEHAPAPGTSSVIVAKHDDGADPSAESGAVSSA